MSAETEKVGLHTRVCGSIHPVHGLVCCIVVYAETKCCHETVYDHDGPHEAIDPNTADLPPAQQRVIKRWEAVLEVKDVPFDGYLPREESMRLADEAQAEADRRNQLQ